MHVCRSGKGGSGEREVEDTGEVTDIKLLGKEERFHQILPKIIFYTFKVYKVFTSTRLSSVHFISK